MHASNMSFFIRGLSIDWEAVSASSYVRGIPAIATLDELEFTTPVTLFSGENGSGKSTLLEAIAVAYGFNPEGGTRNYRFTVHDDTSGLADAVHLTRGAVVPRRGFFFRAETFFNTALANLTEYRAGARGFVDFFEMSHGESFLAFIEKETVADIFIMDEPEAALSPQRQLDLMLHIRRMEKLGAQFIIATHSPILLGYPGAQILSFDGRIHECEYEDTGAYQITNLFLTQRERLLGELMRELDD